MQSSSIGKMGILVALFLSVFLVGKGNYTDTLVQSLGEPVSAVGDAVADATFAVLTASSMVPSVAAVAFEHGDAAQRILNRAVAAAGYGLTDTLETVTVPSYEELVAFVPTASAIAMPAISIPIIELKGLSRPAPVERTPSAVFADWQDPFIRYGLPLYEALSIQ